MTTVICPPGLPVPSGVSLFADRLTSDLTEIGVPVTVTAQHSAGKRWRITCSSARVTMEIDVDGLSRSRLLQKRSSLHVDGAEVEPSNDYEDLLRIYLDPDHRGAEVDWPSVEVPLDDAPEVVRSSAKLIAGSVQLRQLGLTPTVHRAGPIWALVLEAKKIRMQLAFRGRYDWLRPGGDPVVRDSHEVKLWVDGVDYSDKVQGSLDRALAVAATHLSAPKTPAVNREAPSTVNAGAQYHKTTVIRV